MSISTHLAVVLHKLFAASRELAANWYRMTESNAGPIPPRGGTNGKRARTFTELFIWFNLYSTMTANLEPTTSAARLSGLQQK